MSGETKDRADLRPADSAFDVVVIGASAGGLVAMRELLSRLPADFPSCILVVQHLYPGRRSHLAEILARCTQLVVGEATDGTAIRPGAVFVAPPDYHLVLNGEGTMSLSDAEPVRFLRPSADVLFDSAAAHYGKRTLCVILSGTGRDGTLGAQKVKGAGGKVIAQDEASAQHPGMPHAAIASGTVDFVLPIADMSRAILRLVREGD